MLFSITIDCHADGRYEVWAQKKDRLSQAETEEYERARKAAEDLARRLSEKKKQELTLFTND